MMHFTSEISLGAVIELVAFLLAIFKMHLANTKRLQDIETKVGALTAWYDAWMHSKMRRDRDRDED